MDLEKRKQFKQFATWLNNNEYLTEKVQLIPYELAELYLESDFYKQVCKGEIQTSENDTKALRLQNVMPSYSDKVRAWWGHLTNGQKRDYEFKTFGDGEKWEDNTLVYGDIEKMYKIHS